jgi:hypothetical protein
MVKRKAGVRIPFLRMPSGCVDFSATFSVELSIVDIFALPGSLVNWTFELSLLALVREAFFFS